MSCLGGQPVSHVSEQNINTQLGDVLYAGLDWVKQINPCLHPSVILASRMRCDSDCKGNFTATVLRHHCLCFVERVCSHLMCSHILRFVLLWVTKWL